MKYISFVLLGLSLTACTNLNHDPVEFENDMKILSGYDDCMKSASGSDAMKHFCNRHLDQIKSYNR